MEQQKTVPLSFFFASSDLMAKPFAALVADDESAAGTEGNPAQFLESCHLTQKGNATKSLSRIVE